MKKRLISLLLALALLVTVLPQLTLPASAESTGISDASDGASASVTWNGHTYQVFEIGMTWTEAKAYCESKGGHLATITSAEEQKFIESLISSGQKKQYWLGGTDEAQEGTWRWVTGETWSYSNWDAKAPDNNVYNNGEHAVRTTEILSRLFSPTVHLHLTWKKMQFTKSGCRLLLMERSFTTLSISQLIILRRKGIYTQPLTGELSGI